MTGGPGYSLTPSWGGMTQPPPSHRPRPSLVTPPVCVTVVVWFPGYGPSLNSQTAQVQILPLAFYQPWDLRSVQVPLQALVPSSVKWGITSTH